MFRAAESTTTVWALCKIDRKMLSFGPASADAGGEEESRKHFTQRPVFVSVLTEEARLPCTFQEEAARASFPSGEANHANRSQTPRQDAPRRLTRSIYPP